MLLYIIAMVKLFFFIIYCSPDFPLVSVFKFLNVHLEVRCTNLCTDGGRASGIWLAGPGLCSRGQFVFYYIGYFTFAVVVNPHWRRMKWRGRDTERNMDMREKHVFGCLPQMLDQGRDRAYNQDACP
uniref:Uncharacterized protein n=1 Tax=Pipistrellus kuhlii TaxID=59472 RepID=A0A7J7ZJX6_PIPKU|nr:hypothetical protein mPipKuh1_009618 [Pipistrellus kuhlii]